MKKVNISGPLIRASAGGTRAYGATKEQALEALAEKLANALEEATKLSKDKDAELAKTRCTNACCSSAAAVEDKAPVSALVATSSSSGGGSDSLLLSTTRPTPIEQAAEIGDALTIQILSGETYYLIPAAWFYAWRRYVRVDGTDEPGPIDMTLIVSTVDSGRPDLTFLKSISVVGVHHVIVHSSAWSKLSAWYGVKGPAISRVARLGSVNYTFIHVNVLLYSHASGSVDNLDVSVYFGTHETVGDLRRVLATKLRISDADSIRVWDHYFNKTSLIDDYAKSVFDVDLVNGNPIVVEPRHPTLNEFVLTREMILDAKQQRQQS